ncbi:hypothetical protein PAPYR_7992 [Paratrimastix pyriformis]|uniref:Uncharacterized protein n=1 Tax=Paratrimastix pyriformis TaxID=342808 RepID=A0ABQ8UBM4_9EUKA|nr:hypothetical protein PAPYR_7992 [Paratrimastix pyriformis]
MTSRGETPPPSSIEEILERVLQKRAQSARFVSPSSLAVPKNSVKASTSLSPHYVPLQRKHEPYSLEKVMLARLKDAYRDRDVPPTHVRLLEMVEKGALPDSLISSVFGNTINAGELKDLMVRRCPPSATASGLSPMSTERSAVRPGTAGTCGIAPASTPGVAAPPPHPALVRLEPLPPDTAAAPMDDDEDDYGGEDDLGRGDVSARPSTTQTARFWAQRPASGASSRSSSVGAAGRPASSSRSLRPTTASTQATAYPLPRSVRIPPLAVNGSGTRQRFDFTPATIQRTFEASFLTRTARRPPSNPAPEPPKETPGAGLLHDVRAMTGKSEYALELERERELRELGVDFEGSTASGFLATARSMPNAPLPAHLPLGPGHSPPPPLDRLRAPTTTRPRFQSLFANATARPVTVPTAPFSAPPSRPRPRSLSINPAAAAAIGLGDQPPDSARSSVSSTSVAIPVPQPQQQPRAASAGPPPPNCLSPADLVDRYNRTVVAGEQTKRARAVAGFGGLGALDLLHRPRPAGLPPRPPTTATVPRKPGPKDTGREYLRQQRHMRENVHGFSFQEAPTVLTPKLRQMSGALAQVLGSRMLGTSVGRVEGMLKGVDVEGPGGASSGQHQRV